jgi:hypothetical protein
LKRGCLFCRRSDGGFSSREHVLPESLGNTELVLPPGVVCDRCNNGVLASADKTLCEFFPLTMRRTLLGIRSKAGTVPETRFMKGRMASPAPAHIVIDVPNAKDSTTFQETGRSGGLVHMKLEMKGGHKMTPRYCSDVSRALLKAAFECAWLDHGELMLSEEFDHVRHVVLGEPRNGFLALGRTGDPEHNGLQVTYGFWGPPGAQGMWVAAKCLGLDHFTDSRLAVPAEPDLLGEYAMVFPFTVADARPVAS